MFFIGYFTISFTDYYNVQFFLPLFLSILTLMGLHLALYLDNYYLKLGFKISYSISKLVFVLLNAKALSFTCLSYYYLEIALSLYH